MRPVTRADCTHDSTDSANSPLTGFETMTADSVYEKALKVFEKQVHEATQIWYASRTMDEVGLRRKRTIEALNATPLSWIIERGGLAQYALIALGRVFDQSSPRNIDTVVRLTYESRDHVFSKHALAVRKRAGSDNADEWLAAFMGRASATFVKPLVASCTARSRHHPTSIRQFSRRSVQWWSCPARRTNSSSCSARSFRHPTTRSLVRT